MAKSLKEIAYDEQKAACGCHKPFCRAEHPTRRYGCTQSAGHTGNHRACGVDQHNIFEWEQETEEVK